MDLLKFHHNCFGNRTVWYGVKDLEHSQPAEEKKKQKTKPAQCSSMDFAHISVALNEAYAHVTFTCLFTEGVCVCMHIQCVCVFSMQVHVR